MRFAGRVFKAGRFWAIEVPLLGVATQGRTRAEALAMVADAIEALVHRRGFKVQVHLGSGGYFEVGAEDPALLVALLLRRLRARHHLSLAEVARRLGAASHNAYARYDESPVPAEVCPGDACAVLAHCRADCDRERADYDGGTARLGDPVAGYRQRLPAWRTRTRRRFLSGDYPGTGLWHIGAVLL